MREIGEGSLIKDLERNMYAKVVLFNKDDTIDLRYENEDIQWLTKSKERFKVVSNFRIGDKVLANNNCSQEIRGKEGIVVGWNRYSRNPLIKFESRDLHYGNGIELFKYESDENDCWYIGFEEDLILINEENFNNEEKENIMNLELNNLTNEQKKQIIELAKKFEQENEVDKLDKKNDWIIFSEEDKVTTMEKYYKPFMQIFFNLGLTAHTKEEAEKIRRRLLVEKELRDWAKKCKEPVDWESGQAKYDIGYDNNTKEIVLDDFCNYTIGNIMFTDNEIGKQAIESIGQERLIRDYFGIDK